jgi:hypothetical protein
LTAADETQLAGAQAPGAGWIEEVMKKRRSVEKQVPAGTTFERTQRFNYFPRLFRLLECYEPNQYNGAQEDYAHITAPWKPVLGMT